MECLRFLRWIERNWRFWKENPNSEARIKMYEILLIAPILVENKTSHSTWYFHFTFSFFIRFLLIAPMQTIFTCFALALCDGRTRFWSVEQAMRITELGKKRETTSRKACENVRGENMLQTYTYDEVYTHGIYRKLNEMGQKLSVTLTFCLAKACAPIDTTLWMCERSVSCVPSMCGKWKWVFNRFAIQSDVNVCGCFK